MKYRVGGSFALVLNNVRALSEAKQRFKKNRPRIIWKFIVFEHNNHEIEIVRDKFNSLGFNDYEFVLDNRSDAFEEARKTHKKKLAKKKQVCFWLWHTIIIRWNGEVSPCCQLHPFNLGNAISEDIKHIWRSETYKAIRKGFSSRHYGGIMHTNCRICMGLSIRKSQLHN